MRCQSPNTAQTEYNTWHEEQHRRGPEHTGGKAGRSAGTRIPVYLILNLLAHGYDFDRVIQAYPVLTREDIKAALRYAEARMR